MTKAGHTRVLWVPCRHDDGQAIRALETIISEVPQIAKVVLNHRHIGRENRWVAVFTNPVFSNQVHALLNQGGYQVQAESVIGTPYPMPDAQEVTAA